MITMIHGYASFAVIVQASGIIEDLTVITKNIEIFSRIKIEKKNVGKNDILIFLLKT